MLNPGATTVESYSDRQVLAFPDFRGPLISVLLAAGQGDLVSGTVLGRITASGKYARLRRTTLSADGAIGQTVLSVVDASIFKVGQTVSIMEADGTELENLGAITAIDLGANTITVTNALAAAKTAGAWVFVNDGSEVAKVILAEEVPDQAADVNVRAYLGGLFYTSKLVGMDALARADLGARVVEDITVVPA
ncbi:MAG: hypothetical protein AB1523_00240 [Bacillota bacterium]